MFSRCQVRVHLSLLGSPQKLQRNGVSPCRCVGVCVSVSRSVGALRVPLGKYTFVTTQQPPPAACHQHFWRPILPRLYTAMCTAKAVGVCWETAGGTEGGGIEGGAQLAASPQRQHIEHVSGCEGRPRRGCVGGRRDGEGRGGGDGGMRGRVQGNGDGRRAAAFIPWKLIPPFVHLFPIR